MTSGNGGGRKSSRNTMRLAPQTGALTELRYAPKPFARLIAIHTLRPMKQAGSAMALFLDGDQDPAAGLDLLEHRP